MCEKRKRQDRVREGERERGGIWREEEGGKNRDRSREKELDNGVRERERV